MSLFKYALNTFALLLIVGLVFVILQPLVVRSQGDSQNAPPHRTLRSFYLTTTGHNGSQALTACAQGYHMASLWEIFDTSNLKYNTELGLTGADSGSGPPHSGGWIRTGNNLAEPAEISGLGNCNAWTSADTNHWGTHVRLPFFWTTTPAITVISPWDASPIRCSQTGNVWCVQD